VAVAQQFMPEFFLQDKTGVVRGDRDFHKGMTILAC
jgi:hypothetical protein